MIFVDTGAWYAALVQEDSAHAACKHLLTDLTLNLTTTDYVVDELLTLLTVRGNRKLAACVGSQLWNSTLADLYWITPQDVEKAWEIFLRFGDKSWSFTDCTSYSVMQDLGIAEAFALDEHFRQFGFASIKP